MWGKIVRIASVSQSVDGSIHLGSYYFVYRFRPISFGWKAAIVVAHKKKTGCLSSKLSGCSPLHCSRICEVNGKNGCSPYVCRRQRVSKPALHLTYMSVCVETPNESYNKPISLVAKSAICDDQTICREKVSAWTPEAMAERRRHKEISQLADPFNTTQLSEATTRAE